MPVAPAIVVQGPLLPGLLNAQLYVYVPFPPETPGGLNETTTSAEFGPVLQTEITSMMFPLIAGFTVTVVVAAALEHPLTVTFTEYVPALFEAAVKLGFCDVDENPPGPVHEYVAPETVSVVKLIVEPMHTGLLLDTVGVAGLAFTVTVEVAVLEQPDFVTVTEYVVVLPGETDIPDVVAPVLQR